MTSKKINFQFNKFIKQISRRFGNIELSFSDVLGKGFMILIIITLGYNIFTSFRKGQNNLQRISDEEARLEKLLEEGANLDQLEQYYSSVEYRRTYARDSWNLAEPGETLYYIDRDPQQIIDKFDDHSDPIPLRDNSMWWAKLILGS